MNINSRSPLLEERGIAMLIAIIVVVLMVTLIVEFDYGTRVSLTTAGNFRNGVQSMYIAKSGVNAARAILKDDAEKSPFFDATTEF